jgi:aminopeptidase N
LNEGFATYYSFLYLEHRHGHDEMVYRLYNNLNTLVHRNEEYHYPDETRPIVFRGYNVPVEQFDERAYNKGSWVLHMLRTDLGADLFRRCIKTYLERHQYQTVVTADLNAIVEEFSGRSFDRFFDQWFYRSGFPEVDVQYSWDQKRKLAKVSVAQKQGGGDQTKLYHMPLLLRFKSKSGSVDHTVEVKARSEDFYVPLQEAPKIVRVDPDLTLLAKIEFHAPSAMLYAQLSDKDDMAGRLMAADQLAEKKDDQTIAALKVALNKDGFYGVRVRAAEALRTIHTDTALDALVTSVNQSNAFARDSVIKNIAQFYNSKAKEVLLHCLESEHNPIIIAHAIS